MMIASFLRFRFLTHPLSRRRSPPSLRPLAFHPLFAFPCCLGPADQLAFPLSQVRELMFLTWTYVFCCPVFFFVLSATLQPCFRPVVRLFVDPPPLQPRVPTDPSHLVPLASCQEDHISLPTPPAMFTLLYVFLLWVSPSPLPLSTS